MPQVTARSASPTRTSVVRFSVASRPVLSRGRLDDLCHYIVDTFGPSGDSTLGVYSLFDEASGNAIDYSGNGNTGTVTGVTYGGNGQVGKAYLFPVDGGANRVNFGDICKFTDKVTIFAIANLLSTTVGGGNFSNFPTLASKGGNQSYFLLWSPARNMFFSIATSGGEKSSGSTPIAWELNTWYLVVGRYDKDGGTNNLKVDIFGNGIHSLNSSTQTLPMTMTTTAMAFAWDPPRGYEVNVLGQHFGVIHRSITDEEMNRIAQLSGLYV